MLVDIVWTDMFGAVARKETVELDDETLHAIAHARNEVLARGDVIAAIDDGETVEWQVYLDGTIAYVDGSVMDYSSEPVDLPLPEKIVPFVRDIVYVEPHLAYNYNRGD